MRKLGGWVGRVWVCGGLLLVWIIGQEVLPWKVGVLRALLLEVGGLGVVGGLMGEGHLERVSLEFNGLRVRGDS